MDNLIVRDLASYWHPCSQMKDYETFPPMHIIKAKGSYFTLSNGTKILDAISSWWCKNLGHGHPRLRAALNKQAKAFEHVISANTTHELIVDLSEQLTRLTATLKKVLYASDGSCAVEIALKMSCHARQIRNQPEKTQIAALMNGYHGETLFALAVSDLGLYRKPYEGYVPNVNFIQDIPYLSSKEDLLWSDSAIFWNKIQLQLELFKERLSAIIIEPIVQGAGGMQIYSQDFLVKLKAWCTVNDVYLIADEIMTGFGRTGPMLACHHAAIEPDFLCLGKGLTSGYLPMSAVLTTNAIYELFYNEYETGKSFLHSHTQCGNALATAVALETLKLIKEENVLEQVSCLEKELFSAITDVMEKTGKLINVRHIGGIAAADIRTDETRSRAGYAVYKEAVRLGVFLRPLGNTIYWLPPLTIKRKDIQKLRDLTAKAIISAV